MTIAQATAPGGESITQLYTSWNQPDVSAEEAERCEAVAIRTRAVATGEVRMKLDMLLRGGEAEDVGRSVDDWLNSLIEDVEGLE
jgi:hypothetical protein